MNRDAVLLDSVGATAVCDGGSTVNDETPPVRDDDRSGDRADGRLAILEVTKMKN